MWFRESVANVRQLTKKKKKKTNFNISPRRGCHFLSISFFLLTLTLRKDIPHTYQRPFRAVFPLCSILQKTFILFIVHRRTFQRARGGNYMRGLLIYIFLFPYKEKFISIVPTQTAGNERLTK